MSERVFISTGIGVLDELLTRYKPQAPISIGGATTAISDTTTLIREPESVVDFVPGPASAQAIQPRPNRAGVAVPTQYGAASSITVIKGPLGAGKSILSSILAFNFHLKTVSYRRRGIIPFAIYFSYSQPAQGLYHYIDDILLNPAAHHQSDDPTGKRWYPVILSPKEFERGSQKDGITKLEDFLVKQLKVFDDLQFETGDFWSQARSKLNHHFGSLIDAWNSEIDSRTTIPDRIESKERLFQVRPFVFVDPINFFFEGEGSRQTVARLLQTFRNNMWPLVVTIEDAGENASESNRQLMSFVEFEADVVIDLVVRSTPYIRHTIEIKKNRNSQPVFGPQQYRIEKRGHSLWNIQEIHGFLIFPSIHWFLSHARERHQCRFAYYSGMSAFDGILGDHPEGADPQRQIAMGPSRPGAMLPPDSVILIRGQKGGHKLSVGFNLLVAGLWDLREDDPDDGERLSNVRVKRESASQRAGRVLLLSLGEEIGLSIPRIALCNSHNQPSSQDNGSRIEFRPQLFSQPDAQRQKSRFKITLREWDAFQPNASKPHGSRLIEATFKPGSLSADEFLWTVETLVDRYKPSRLMVENTAHLRMRFPELHHERMLFAALASLTQSHQIMLIVTDVLGAGSDQELSYGLAASADFVVDLSALSLENFHDVLPTGHGEAYTNCMRELDGCIPSGPAAGATWSLMSVSNVRGKNYRRGKYGVAVCNMDGKNCLFIVDITEFFTLSESRRVPRGRLR